MIPDELFGATFECTCGRTHTVAPEKFLYREGAASALPALLARATDGRRVAVLLDARTARAAGDEAAEVLRHEQWLVERVLVPDPPGGGSPVCDDDTQRDLDAGLGEVDAILTVGSGVVTDLGKWIAHGRSVPQVALATAASMNGYASANVAVTLEGLKTLVRARPPTALVADPAVLAAAPAEMTAAGLGDVLAKSVSSADWYVNHVLFGDYYCPAAVGLVADLEPLYLDRPEALASGDAAAMESLFRALALTGVAMTMAETSAPASGGEHLVSHALDMMSASTGVAHDLHGRQVGVGTILAAWLYERLLAMNAPAFRAAAPHAVNERLWGPASAAVAEEYAKKQPRIVHAAERLAAPGVWKSLGEAVAPMLRPPRQIRDVLRRAGAARRAEDIGCTRERLRLALLHGHEMRSRFTILDLATMAGLLPDAADEALDFLEDG